MKKVGKEAFAYSGVESVSLPNVVDMGQDAFRDCTSLARLTIPVDLSFDTTSFYNCTSLATIEYTPGETGVMPDVGDGGGADYFGYRPENRNNAGALETVVFDEGVKSIGANAFAPTIGRYSHANQLSSVTLPSTLEEVGGGAFASQSGIDPSLPEGARVTKLGSYAFKGCTRLGTGTIQHLIRDVDEVPYQCFCGCTGLTELVVDPGVALAEGAFEGCTSLSRLTVPVDYSYDTRPFYNCTSLATIEYTPGETGVMPDVGDGGGADYFGYRPENRNNAGALETVVFDEGVKSIGANAFAPTIGRYSHANQLSSVTLPSTLEEVGGGAFASQSGIDPSLPEGARVTKLGSYAFKGCTRLGTGTIQHLIRDVDEVPYQCFCGCTGLTELVVDPGVALAEGAFEGCTSLSRLTVPVDYSYDTRPFYNCTSLATIEYTPGETGVMPDVGDGGGADYFGYRPENRNNAGALETVVFDEGVKSIGANAFAPTIGRYSHANQLSSVTLPSTLEEVGGGAFASQSGIDPSLPEGARVTKLGSYAFKGCTRLGTGTIQHLIRDVDEVPYQCFCGCTGLTELVVDPGVALAEGAFEGCTSLSRLTVPVDYSYDTRPFYNCTSLATIEYTPGETGVMPDVGDGGGADYFGYRPENRNNAGALETVVFDEGVKSIGANAFAPTIGRYSHANQLSSVTLPSTLEEVGTSAIPTGSSILIYGAKGSFAEEFAESNGNMFVALNYPYIAIDEHKMLAGTSQQLAATVFTGVDESTDEVVWGVSGATDPGTAIDDSGLLAVARGERTGTITVTATYGEATSSVEVQVTAVEKPGQRLEGEAEVRRTYGDEPFAVGVSLAEGDGELSYASSDERIATVDADGVVTIVGAGQATITVTASETEAYNQATFEVALAVAKRARQVEASIDKPELTVGETAAMTAPEGASFASADESVATVDGKGVVTAVSQGTTRIEVSLPETANELAATTTVAVTVVEPAHVHALEHVAAVPATCEGDGAEECWKCSGCGALFSDEGGTAPIDAPTVIEALGHDWDEGVVTAEPTCTAEGERTFTCKRDGAHKRTEAIEALGHDYAATVVEPTCTEAGYTVHACSRCGDSYTDSEVAALGHSWADAYTLDVEPTCSSEGSESIHCAVCGAVKEGSSRPVAKAAHDWGEWETVAEPTQGGQGEKRRVCRACGEVETEAIPALARTGWVEDGGETYYYRDDGTMVAGKWEKIDGKWYHFDSEGAMEAAKWVKDSKGWCYLGADGAMATDKWVRDSKGWCYVGSDGYCVTNQWKKDSKGWCYLGSDGRMAVNKWVSDSKGWCYVGADGYCVTNKWVKDSKGWVYLDSSGRMATDKWVRDSKGWCYVGSDGYAVHDQWRKDSKGWCYLDENCRLTIGWKQIKGTWYYFDSSGRMVTGTQTINGKTYRFASNGALVGEGASLQAGSIDS